MKFFSIEKLVGVLTLIPAAGFVLALCYQYTFLVVLGVKPLDVLQIGDLLLSSAVLVLPTTVGFVVILIVQGGGDLFFSAKPHEDKSSRQETPLLRLLLDLVFFGLIYFSAFIFVVFGAAPELGAFSLSLVVWRVLLRIFAPYLHLLHRVVLVAFAFYSLTATLFVASATSKAFDVRSGGKTLASVELFTQPIKNQNLELVSNLSGGLLALNRGNKELVFFDNDGYSLLFTFNSNPPKGLMCFLFGYCNLSNWAFIVKDKTAGQPD